MWEIWRLDILEISLCLLILFGVIRRKISTAAKVRESYQF